MNTSKLTCGQIEQILSDRIEEFYRQNFGYCLSSVTCHLFNATLAIAVERSKTPVDNLLATAGKERSLELFRETLHKSLGLCIREWVEEILQTTVVDLLIDSNLKTGRTGSIAILAKAPKFPFPAGKSLEATNETTLS